MNKEVKLSITVESPRMKKGESDMPYGLTVKEGTGDTRIEIQCAHQSGLIYVVPADASWVCQPEHLHAHAIAGFFRELMELADPRISGLMQRWGLYYRPRPLDTGEDQA